MKNLVLSASIVLKLVSDMYPFSISLVVFIVYGGCVLAVCVSLCNLFSKLRLCMYIVQPFEEDVGEFETG